LDYDDEYFNKRPFDKEWIMYCAYDVVYLVDAYLNMSHIIKKLVFDKYQIENFTDKDFLIIYYLLSYTHYGVYCQLN